MIYWWQLHPNTAKSNEYPQTEQKLGDMIRVQDPSIMFLAETWLDKARLEDIWIRFKFGGLIEVSREAWGGGIAILLIRERKMSGASQDFMVNQIQIIIIYPGHA